jgi:prolyl-tRNA synthetase
MANVVKILDEIQSLLFQRAVEMRTQNSHRIESLADFRDFFGQGEREESAEQGGFVYAHWSESAAMHDVLKELKVTPRCIPLDAETESGKCLFTGQPSTKRLVFAKSY